MSEGIAPQEFHTTRDMVIPAGTRLINLSGKLIFGSFTEAPGHAIGLSMGMDNALHVGLVEPGPAPKQ